MGWTAALIYSAATVLLLLRTRPGRVGIDTKQYLYVDPGRLLSDAASMWEPGVAFGTVPHQRIGFLWPMAPFFWAGDRLGLPDWVTQRLWLAALFVAAGLGVRALGRYLGLSEAGAWAAAVAYAWNPYSLGYVHRTSVLLLPWAGLGWLVLLAARAVRRGGWRDPAAFALVALTVGGANATAFLLAGLAPALWLVHEALGPGAVRRRALRAGGRLALLTAGVSVWWAVALAVQGRYGLNVLRYSETVDAVARSTSATEVMRGLGYWLFYGRDRLDPWIEPAPSYQTSLPLLAVTFAVPLLGLAALAVTRWRHRRFSAALVLVGLVLAVGAYPWESPSPLGRVFKAAAEASDAGLALRSSSRAVPLIVLGLALPLGAAVTALAGRTRWGDLAAAALVAVVAVAAFPPLWHRTLVAENLSRPEDLPAAWRDAARWLDERPHDTRILEVPGIDLTFHRWGAVWEPVTPGLTDRPYAARELIPYGAPGGVDLLTAFDRRLQEGTLEPAAIAPIARLVGAGDLVLRSDLQYERYRTPRPRRLWADLLEAPGLGSPASFGEPTPNVPRPELPLLDEVELGTPDDAPHPPPVAAFPVDGVAPLLHASTAAGTLVVDGSGDGLVDAAAEGLLDDPGAVFYSGSFADDPDGLDRLLEDSADLLVTDTNRRQAMRWRTLRDNTGQTEAAGERPVRDDPSDARLDLFPDAGDESRSVTLTTGARATATAYGNPVTLTPDVRPQLAVDGDPATAWMVGAFSDVRGERLVVDLNEPRTIDELTIVQAGTLERRIGRLQITADGATAAEVTLDDTSTAAPGQPVAIDTAGPVERIELEILDTVPATDAASPSLPPVGIAEVGIPGLATTEAVRLPVDLLDAAGARRDNRLVFAMTRRRSDPAEVVRGDDELSIQRVVELPVGRSFSLAGAARVSMHAPDEQVWQVLGGNGPSPTATDSLGGDLASRPWAALDGDPGTRWRPGFGDQAGRWIEVPLGSTRTFDRLDLQLVADGRHSVPVSVTVEAGGERREVRLPPVSDKAEPGAVVAAPIRFPSLTGDRLRVTMNEVRPRLTRDWYRLSPIVTPVGIAELGVPGLPPLSLPERVPGDCRDDLLEVNGEPVTVRVTGGTEAAIAGGGLQIEPCSRPVDLASGTSLLSTATGREVGIDVDRVVLASAPGGGPAADPREPLGQQRGPRPAVEVLASGVTRHEARVDTAGHDTILALGESRNDGWHATADGVDLGPPRLVDGYANGWVIPASDHPVEVTLRWTPQRAIHAGLIASGVAALACLALVVLARRPRAGALPAPRDIPKLGPPWEPTGPLPPVTTAIAITSAAAVATAVAGPAIGLVTTALTAIATRWTGGRVVLLAGGVLTLAASFALVVLGQERHRWAADFDWPTHFDLSHRLTLLGALLLLAGVALTHAGDREEREPVGGDG
ncbi:MAG: alpha-(1-_3)-arabinofuranosyltransferase domain-containing protein [Acidimicrobiales bacterium]